MAEWSGQPDLSHKCEKMALARPPQCFPELCQASLAQGPGGGLSGLPGLWVETPAGLPDPGARAQAAPGARQGPGPAPLCRVTHPSRAQRRAPGRGKGGRLRTSPRGWGRAGKWGEETPGLAAARERAGGAASPGLPKAGQLARGTSEARAPRPPPRSSSGPKSLFVFHTDVQQGVHKMG